MASTLGGCSPLNPPDGRVFQPIRSMVYELQKLSPEDYRCVAITIKVSLTTNALSGSLSYRVPATFNLAIERIVPHLQIADFSAETSSLGNIGQSTDTLSFENRVNVKLMNCNINMQNSDRNQPLFDNGPINLYALARNPIDWTSKPHIVPASELLSGDATLVDTDSAVVGGSTSYGIVLLGTLVRVKNS